MLVGQAVDAAALVDNDRVRRGHPGWPGDPGFPAYVDLVVEGPNVHRHIDGPRACGFQVGSNTGAWIQSIAEPAHIYDDTLWCPHAAPPAVRFDTSLAKFKERAYGERATSYLWAPYSQMHLVGNAALSDRKFSGGDCVALPPGRGWRCRRCAVERRRVDGGGVDMAATSSAGPSSPRTCRATAARHRDAPASATPRVSRAGTGGRARSARAGRVLAHARLAGDERVPGCFGEYRFVETFENAEEVGYVTEKLGSAMSSGAVPVYWGDPQAAAMVFDLRAFIDAKGFWRDNGMVAAANSVAAATDGDWASLAQHVIDVDKDEALFRSFLLPDVRARHDDEQRGADPRPEATRVPAREAGGTCLPFLGRQHGAGRGARASAAGEAGGDALPSTRWRLAGAAAPPGTAQDAQQLARGRAGRGRGRVRGGAAAGATAVRARGTGSGAEVANVNERSGVYAFGYRR